MSAVILVIVFHYRKNYQRYKNFPRPVGCSFCEDDLAGRSLTDSEYCYVVPNRVSYDLWEMREVVEHLMIIPKQHVHGFAELSDAAKLDIMDTIADYEARGFNVYARGIGASARSVDHQHTHLIRTKPQKARAMVGMHRPYVLVKF